jgi:LPS export ABC transporter protein LptC
MTSSRSFVIITLALLLVGGGLAIWNAERKATPPPPPKAAQTDQSKMVGQDVTFIVTEGELKKWKLEAKKAVYNESHTDAQLTDVRGEFYSKDGKPVLVFTAPTGNYVNENHAVTLTGGVVARTVGAVKQTASPMPLTPSKDGSGGVLSKGELLAPKMVWDAKTDWVNASGGVNLNFEQGKSSANACRFNLDFSQVYLRGNVRSALSAST